MFPAGSGIRVRPPGTLVDAVGPVLPCARLTTQPLFLLPACAHAAPETNGKPSLPGGKRETLTDSPRENDVRVWSEDGLAVVTPLAQVDAGNAQQFWAALASVTRDHSVIVADLSAQQDCDWHAMGALMMALKHTDSGGGELRVAAGRSAVRQVLTESGLDRLVTVFGTLAEAMPGSHPPLEPGLPGLEPA